MSYSSTADLLPDLRKRKELLVFDEPIAAEQEISAVLRRVYACGGPAVLFSQVKGTPFPVIGNLYGTLPRARFLLRHGLSRVEKVMRLKADPGALLRQPWKYLDLPLSLPHVLPRSRPAPVLTHQTQLDQLPRHISWPDDGGPFVTLPAVYSEHPQKPGWLHSNLGMYRVQLAGNEYLPNREVGLHYQIHRGLGIHHQACREKLWVNICIGGPPAVTWSAVMPLPENIPEVLFAAGLAGRPMVLARSPVSPLPVLGESDFVIVGWIDPTSTKPEGPFGDHLGYYSLRHPFPVMRVEAVYHRPGAIWPVTTVGRPPQEDTTFGQLIHELTGPVLPTVLAGVKEVHAVDAAGVHPLLLALASERYTPYQKRKRPAELLTCANAILGQGQLSLAKYLWIAAQEDNPDLHCHDIARFLMHMLERVEWWRDLHFQTQTNMDTLDYSGGELNVGSKVVIAAVGPARRQLPTCWEGDFRLPVGFDQPQLCLPGVIALRAKQAPKLLEELPCEHPLGQFPLWVCVDDSQPMSAHLNNFLWTTFTRSNPAVDIYGVQPLYEHKHWGCRGPLIIDARAKPHHAPALEEDPQVVIKIKNWGKSGGPLAGYLPD